MICSTCLYSEYLVSTNNARLFPFKAQNTSLHLSTENRTFFEFPLSCIAHCCQFHFIYFDLTDTGYSPNLFSKHRLLCGLSLCLKISASFFFFFFAQRLFTCFMSNSVKPQRWCKKTLVSTFKALKTCQVVRSSFPQSDISVVLQLSPLCPIMSSHQLWHPNTDWCCYF